MTLQMEDTPSVIIEDIPFRPHIDHRNGPLTHLGKYWGYIRILGISSMNLCQKSVPLFLPQNELFIQLFLTFLTVHTK